jgi:hypothetical protein
MALPAIIVKSLPDLPTQINQRCNDANCAEQFRQHPDIGPGHDSLQLSSADLPVNQFWMSRQFSTALDRLPQRRVPAASVDSPALTPFADRGCCRPVLLHLMIYQIADGT